VNRIDQETEKEARAHKGCRAIQEVVSFISKTILYGIILCMWFQKMLYLAFVCYSTGHNGHEALN
jgi:hypothetical protein